MTVEQIEKMDEENQRFWRGVMEREEQKCANHLATGFPCDTCELKSCIHPEKAIWGSKRR